MIVSRKGFFFSLFVSIVAVAPSIERCCKTKTLSIWTISNTKRSTIPVFHSLVSLILVVTFPEGGFASSLFTADRCLFSQNRSFSNQDRQIEQIHCQCTARLQTVSSAPSSLRKRTRPAAAKNILRSSDSAKDIEMTDMTLYRSEEVKMLKPVIESLGKSIMSGEAEGKGAHESSNETHITIKDKELNRKRPIRMARIVDYVFCVAF